MMCPSSPDFFHLPSGSSTDWMVGNRKSDEVKMKSIPGSAVIADFEPGQRHLRIPLGRDLDRRLEEVGMRADRVHEPGAALHRVRVGEVAHQDQRLQLLAGRVELLLRLGHHGVDRGAGHRLVVGDDDDALGHVRGRPVEGGDRHVGLLRLGHDHAAGITVVGGQDDAVGALSDAVLDLLELPVGVLAAVELDHLDAGVLQRLDDGRVAGDPEAGRQVLEGVADRAALLGLGTW